MNLDVLRNELLNDPEAIGYSSHFATRESVDSAWRGGNDVAVLALGQAPRATGLRPLSVGDVVRWAGAIGKLADIRRLKDRDVAAIANLGYVVEQFFTSATATLDLDTDKLFIAGVQAAAGITDEQMGALQMLASVQISRFESLGISDVSTNDVSLVLRGQ